MITYTLTLVTTSFPIRGDGSEAAGSFVADLVEELAKYVKIRVVAPGFEEMVEAWASNVEVFRYRAPPQALSTLKLSKFRDLFAILNVLRSGARMTQLAATGSQHIIALWALPCGEWARRAALKMNITYSVWMLGSDIWVLGRIPIIRSILANVIQKAKHAYADGYLLAKDAEDISRRTIKFLPSTRKIAITAIEPPRSKPPYRLLFLGRWHTNKGVDLLLDALLKLSNEDWALIERVEIQGGGPLQVLVENGILELQRKQRPVICGCYLAKDAAEQAISRADWLLIPSRIESIPVVFSDAMKMGRPVVCMPVGDFPKLFTESKVGEMAQTIHSDAYLAAIKNAMRMSPDEFVLPIEKMACHFDLGKIAIKLLAEVMGS